MSETSDGTPAVGAGTLGSDPVSEPAQGEAAAKPRRAGVLSRAGLGLVLIVGVFAGAAIVRYALPDLPGSKTASLASDVAELKAQMGAADVAGLARRLDEAERRLKGLSPSDVAELKSRLDAAAEIALRLDERITALEGGPGGPDLGAAPAGVPPDSAGVAALSAQLYAEIGQMKARIDALAATDAQANQAMAARFAMIEASAETFIDRAALDGLALRIAALESNAAAVDARRMGSAIALANLARAAQADGPFEEELRVVEGLGAGDALIERIAPFARTGVPAKAALIEAFPQVARASMRAANAGAGVGWFGRLLANIKALFLIRRTGALEGDAPEAVIARAELAAGEGDLKRALDELSRLAPEALEVSARWREEAAARLALDALLKDLAGELVAVLPQ